MGRGNCKYCAEVIEWVRVGDGWVPTNLDGTDHRAECTRKAKPAAKPFNSPFGNLKLRGQDRPASASASALDALSQADVDSLIALGWERELSDVLALAKVVAKIGRML